jgi:lipoprotein-anchoring transpeptidase ErfK/SrfK
MQRRAMPPLASLPVLRRRIALLLAVASLAVTACGGGGGDDRPTVQGPTHTAPSTTLAPNTSIVAHVKGSEVHLYDAPGALKPSRTLPNPWLLNEDPNLPVPMVFLVLERRGDEWARVLLPERPNGSSAWVKTKEVQLVGTRFRIVVEVGAHRITVFDGDNVILQEPVAVGMPSTPTPLGLYYLRVLLQAPDPTTVYGPYAYGLSGHSDVLTEFNGGDGEVGIHGNNDASVLGQSVSHGCVRMSNEGITKLAGLLPLGTPVEIVG